LNCTRRSKRGNRALIHSDGLREVEVVKVGLRAELLGRQAKKLPKGTGERFMRTVARGESDPENVRSSLGKHLGSVSQTPRAHIRGRENTRSKR